MSFDQTLPIFIEIHKMYPVTFCPVKLSMRITTVKTIHFLVIMDWWDFNLDHQPTDQHVHHFSHCWKNRHSEPSSTFRVGFSRGHSDVSWGVAVRGQRTHDVCCPICKAIVTDQGFAVTFRAMESVLTTEKAAIGHRLAPQHNGNNTNLTPECKNENVLTL